MTVRGAGTGRVSRGDGHGPARRRAYSSGSVVNISG